MPGDEGTGLAAQDEAQIFEAVNRQVRRWMSVTPAEAGVQSLPLA